MPLLSSQVQEKFSKVASLSPATLDLLVQSARFHELNVSIILEQVVIVWKPWTGCCSKFYSVLFISSLLHQSLILSPGITLTGFPLCFLLPLPNVVYLGFGFFIFFIPITGVIVKVHTAIQMFAQRAYDCFGIWSENRAGSELHLLHFHTLMSHLFLLSLSVTREHIQKYIINQVFPHFS